MHRQFPEGQSAHSRYSASAWTLDSRPSDAGFAGEIVTLAHQLDVGSIMPVAEGYHNALISIRDSLELGIHLFSPSRELFDKATDKDYLPDLCSQTGIQWPRG